jgi:phosphoglucosamine mutase
MMVDEGGKVIDGDGIIFIIAREAMRNGQLQGGVVGTKMSNLGMEVALEKLGIPFARADVGDRYVMEMLLAKNWKIGGENSGHVLNLNLAPTGDGIVAGLQVIAAMLRTNMKLSVLNSGFTPFPQRLINVKFADPSKNPLESDEVNAIVKKAEEEMGDNGRVLLRKSGTEPLLRVMVEAIDKSLSDFWAEKIADVVKKSS